MPDDAPLAAVDAASGQDANPAELDGSVAVRDAAMISSDAAASQNDAGSPACAQLGGPGMFDGEVLSSPPRLAFQDGASIWIGALDPQTGLLASATGRDVLVSSSATSIMATFNGPEWGADRAGPSVYFTQALSGTNQLFAAPLSDPTNPRAITMGSEPRVSPIPSRDAADAAARVLFLKGRVLTAQVAYLDTAAPQTDVLVPAVERGVSGPRWIPGTRDFLFARNDGQLARFVTATGQVQALTSDAGAKTDPFPVYAPELGGALAIVAIADQRDVVVYQERGPSWERVATHPIPAGSPHPFVYSVEPFVSDGRAFASLHAQATRVTPPMSTESSIWVYELFQVGRARRLDDGRVAHRIDPETFYGSNEVFVLFNILPGGGAPWEMHRCRTGIPTR